MIGGGRGGWQVSSTIDMLSLKKARFCPSGFCSVDRASACGLKGPRFSSGQGHLPGLQIQSPVGGMQEAADQ